MNQEHPSTQTPENPPETARYRLLKALGIDSSKWTLGDRLISLVAIGIGLAIAIVSVCGYVFDEWEWTGLTTPNPRTFWDWLDLFIVPIVLGLGGYLFTRSESRWTQDVADQQAQD